MSRESGAPVVSARRRSQLARLATLLNDETDDEYVPSAGESDADSEFDEDDEDRASAQSEPQTANNKLCAATEQDIISAGGSHSDALSVSLSESRPTQPSVEPTADDPSVALRTRSKQPLTDVSIAELERNLPLIDAELDPLLGASALPPARLALCDTQASGSSPSWQPLDTPRKTHAHSSGFTLGDLSALLDDAALQCANPFTAFDMLDSLLCPDEEREWRVFLAELNSGVSIGDALSTSVCGFASTHSQATAPTHSVARVHSIPTTDPQRTMPSDRNTHTVHTISQLCCSPSAGSPAASASGALSTDDDEERADPSFNMLEAIIDMDALDDDLREELRSDRGTRVSKRELNELLAEYYALTQADDGNADSAASASASAPAAAPEIVDGEFVHSQPANNVTTVCVSSIVLPAATTTTTCDSNLLINNKTSIGPIEESPKMSSRISPSSQPDPPETHAECTEAPQAAPLFGEVEQQLLRDQLVMHVQLLAQLHLLTCALPACQPHAQAARFYLSELQFAARTQRSIYGLASSFFDACNLEAACALVLAHADSTQALTQAPARDHETAHETTALLGPSFNGMRLESVRTLVASAAFPCPDLVPLRAPFYTDAPSAQLGPAAETSAGAKRELREARAFVPGEDRLLLQHLYSCRRAKRRCGWAEFRRSRLPCRTLPQIQQRLAWLLTERARRRRSAELERSTCVPRAFSCNNIPCTIRWY